MSELEQAALEAAREAEEVGDELRHEIQRLRDAMEEAYRADEWAECLTILGNALGERPA